MVSRGSIPAASIGAGLRGPAAVHRGRTIAIRCGYASIAASLLGALLVSYGVAALPSPWTSGYVSEAGAVSAPHHIVYRIGIAAFAVALGTLAVAVARIAAPPAPRPWLHRLPAAWIWLAVGAAFGSVSSRVSCTTGCPLPPYQATTAQDVIHAVTSVGAVGFVALAMLTIAIAYPAGTLRRLARWGVTVCIPPLIFMAIAIGAIGRGRVAGVTERVSLILVLAWVVGSAAVATRSR